MVHLLVDNDVLIKAAHWGLLDHIPSCAGTTWKHVAVLESLIYRARKRDKKLFRDPAAAKALAREYAAARSDVELLVARLEKSDRKRKDLWCPLPSASKETSAGKVIRHPAAEEYERRSAQAALTASMTPAERQHGRVAEPAKRAKATRPHRHPATPEELLESAMQLSGDTALTRDA